MEGSISVCNNGWFFSDLSDIEYSLFSFLWLDFLRIQIMIVAHTAMIINKLIDMMIIRINFIFDCLSDADWVSAS